MTLHRVITGVLVGGLVLSIAACSSKKKDDELKKEAEKAGEEIGNALVRDIIKKEYEPLKARHDKGDVLKYDDYREVRKDAYKLEKDKSPEAAALLKQIRTLTESDAPARDQIATMDKTLGNIKKFGADEFWTNAMKGDCKNADELLGKIKEANVGETEGQKLLTAKKTEACTPENTTPAPPAKKGKKKTK